MSKIGTFLAKLLKDDKGNPSMMRLMMFVVCVSGLIYMFAGGATATVLGVLGIAFGGKSVQSLGGR